MATSKKNKLSHEAYLAHMKKYLPENEKVLSGGYSLQNPKWMGKNAQKQNADKKK